jgi:hypothetical protein
MNQESIEAVWELCLQTQHENTVRTILQHLLEQYDRTVCDEQIMIEIETIEQWIANLKLEDTK